MGLESLTEVDETREKRSISTSERLIREEEDAENSDEHVHMKRRIDQAGGSTLSSLESEIFSEGTKKRMIGMRKLEKENSNKEHDEDNDDEDDFGGGDIFDMDDEDEEDFSEYEEKHNTRFIQTPNKQFKEKK